VGDSVAFHDFILTLPSNLLLITLMPYVYYEVIVFFVCVFIITLFARLLLSL